MRENIAVHCSTAVIFLLCAYAAHSQILEGTGGSQGGVERAASVPGVSFLERIMRVIANDRYRLGFRLVVSAVCDPYGTDAARSTSQVGKY